MASYMQLSIRNLLIAAAAISLVIALYASNRTAYFSQTYAVGFFGPGPLDYGAAHEQLLAEIDSSKYQPIDSPKWAAGITGTTGTGARNHVPSRSDWLLLEKNGAKNFVHVTSSENGFSIEVIIYKLSMKHQTVYRENQLVSETIPYFANWWSKWLAENSPGAKGI